MSKKIIDFLVKFSNLLSYIAEMLRLSQFHEEYYVYVPNNNKPKYIHENYKSARQEAERLLNIVNPLETVEILQVVNRFQNEDIPF